MKIKITGAKVTDSKYGGSVFALFFKDLETGKALRSWIDPKCGNFKRWEGIIKRAMSGEEIILDGAITKKPGLIDADSQVTEVKQ